MEAQAIEALRIGGAPSTLIIIAVFSYRWLNSKFNSIDERFDTIDKGMNLKQNKEMCDERHEDHGRRIGRLETFANGALK